MSQKGYNLISAIIFTIVALVHVWRLSQGWGITIDTWIVPMWVSWAGLVIPGVLAFYGFRLSR